MDNQKNNTLKVLNSYTALRTFKLNFGPQHPAAHGVLRLVLELNGEVVLNSDPHIGFLHRGTEKLIENKMYHQSIPYFDRLDYVSMMTQEHAFILAIENALDITVPLRGQFIRVIFSEITRILNHLMAVTTHAMDVGALTPFLWGFEEREKLMCLYEKVSGARMHAAYFRIGGVSQDLPGGILSNIYYFINQFKYRLSEIVELLDKGRIWRQRLVGVGSLSKKNALNIGHSGVLLRSTGTKSDLRQTSQYEVYSKIIFQSPIGMFGDSYDRYLLRVDEMFQSIAIIQQAINLIPEGLYKNMDSKINPPLRRDIINDMESTIHHFKYYSEGVKIKNYEGYVAIESPKGEFGVYLVSAGEKMPERCKIRAAGFYHLSSLNYMTSNHFLADVTTVIGTQDIVFGEIDR